MIIEISVKTSIISKVHLKHDFKDVARTFFKIVLCNCKNLIQ